MRTSARSALLLTLLATGGCAAARAPAVVVSTREWGQWRPGHDHPYRVEVTASFLESPGDLQRLQDFVALIEPAHEALERAFAREVPGGVVRLDGALIDDLGRATVLGEVAAIYWGARDLIVLRELERGSLLHELTHRFCARSWARRPARWIEEGLARAVAARLEGDSLLVAVMALRHLHAGPGLQAPSWVRVAALDRPTTPPRDAIDEFIALWDLPVLPGMSVDDMLAAVIMDRLLRDEGGPASPGSAARAVARARSLDPDEAAAVLERAAFSGFPAADDVRDALTTEVPDSVLERLLPSLDLDLAVAVAGDDPVARRRLALWLREPRRARQGAQAEVAWLHERLGDDDPQVVRAAALALGARGDARALPVLMAELERLPDATFGTHGEGLFVHPVLVKLAGGLPDGVPAIDPRGSDEQGWDEQGRRLRLRPELLEAWRRWWATRRDAGPPP